ncbi:MAG: winged helix-turn-helix domain-containing protein [Ktedonobacteraceae bacterium]|nr:winged helix-turn-helix domain-containing protein [Ktedonobacteraceae bacterium]
MIHSRSNTLYDRITHPTSNSQSDQYRLAKITLPRHTFLYNDEAQIVLVADTLNDQIFYIHCTPAEYAILRQLLSMPNEVLPFEQLADHFLDQFEYQRDIRTLRRHICRLKRKLPSPLKIISVREVGYVLQERSQWAAI